MDIFDKITFAFQAIAVLVGLVFSGLNAFRCLAGGMIIPGILFLAIFSMAAAGLRLLAVELIEQIEG
jgi:hypothetical protein